MPLVATEAAWLIVWNGSCAVPAPRSLPVGETWICAEIAGSSKKVRRNAIRVMTVRRDGMVRWTGGRQVSFFPAGVATPDDSNGGRRL